MKKTLLGIFTTLCISCGVIFAQNILPDEAEIEVKNPITQGESTNITITMKKNGDKMTSYNGTIFMMITDEDGIPLNPNEYTLPNQGTYTFLTSDMGSKPFQRGLEIKKEGNFYIEISDFDDDNILGKKLITVQKNRSSAGLSDIEILNPNPDIPLNTEVIDLIANAPDLQNSFVTIYIDDTPIQTSSIVMTDSEGLINYKIPNISAGKHTLSLEIQDVDGTVLGNSKTINFTYSPEKLSLFKDITITPDSDDLFRVEDTVTVEVTTDELAESVTMILSDRPENDSIVMDKDGNGQFSKKFFLIKTGNVDFSLQISASNNTDIQTFSEVKSINVEGIPTITNITTEISTGTHTVDISRDVENGPISDFLINFGYDENNLEYSTGTTKQTIQFTGVPEDTPVYLQITPFWKGGKKHGAASKTIQFVISKPNIPIINDEVYNPDGIMMPDAPKKCTVHNINTRTQKIGDKYYLVRDKVENVTKYIVYSSSTESVSDRVKIYETTDTSYEYPFDHTSEDDIFMYYRIDGVCDEKEELQLSGATKVQVGPTENFFLLICMTLLIYFGIKVFRQTEE